MKQPKDIVDTYGLNLVVEPRVMSPEEIANCKSTACSYPLGYRLELKSDAIGKSYKFDYTCGTLASEPEINSVLGSIQSDLITYYLFRDSHDFAYEFGYKDFREADKIWSLIEENFAKLKLKFGTAFIDDLLDMEPQ